MEKYLTILSIALFMFNDQFIVELHPVSTEQFEVTAFQLEALLSIALRDKAKMKAQVENLTQVVRAKYSRIPF